ncbi:MAG: ATP synthase F1 subunit delta [Proteobacteria bacterium]|nr:ATP synthase F1 subunit delta [Pseudomonadota bacterium]MBU1569399.1 ATP synthase F1 subunit delta [Pseudomonadota bacterium]
MKNLAISRRYARALLLLGKDDGNAEIYKQELDTIAKLVANEKGLELALTNPLYNAVARKKVLQLVIEKLNLSKAMKSFLFLLFDKGRIGFLGTINEFYQKLADELKNVARASLVSATEISAETVEKIHATLSKMTGKDIVLDVKVDQSLIGGVVSRIGDLVLDGSIKTQLLNMRESLKRGESV